MELKSKAYNHINQLKTHIDKLGYVTSNIEEKNYNYEFVININSKKIKVQVYFGKKGIKTIIQGDISSTEFHEIKKIVYEEIEFNYDNDIDEPDEYVGTDESGKGDYFGPLVVSAVYVDSKIINKLKQLGVKDSKELSDEQIHYLANEIKKITNDANEIIIITPQKYNELYDKFKNLNKLLNWAHSKAIQNLLLRKNCKTVITDKFSNKDLNVSFDNNHSSVKFIQVTHGEKYIGVAAASILARNAFNEWFYMQSKNGINLLKGSSSMVNKNAVELIKKIGKENLGKFAKLHFKTTKNIL